MVRLLIVLTTLLSTLFFAPSVAAESGGSTHQISSGGLDRSYLLYVPADLPPSAPLVVVLHGLSGTADSAQRLLGWNGAADANKFVVAYPDGIGKSWNTTADCCGKAGRDNVDDIGFISAVVRDVMGSNSIDPARTFVTGHSNGAVMALRMACNTDLFAAVEAVSGTQLGGCAPPIPTSVIQINGTSDPIIKYDGSRGFGFAGGQPVSGISDFWRGANGCPPPAQTVDGALTIDTSSCPNGRAVEQVTVAKGGHAWPPFATGMVWNFFAAHPR